MPPQKITVVDIKDDDTADIVDSNEVATLEPVIEENFIETQDKPIALAVQDTPVEENQLKKKQLKKKHLKK